VKAALRKIRKALGALLGGATGAAVVATAEAFELSVDPTLAGAIAIILAAAGAYLAPPNATNVPGLDRAYAALRMHGIDPNDVLSIRADASEVDVERVERDEGGRPIWVDGPGMGVRTVHDVYPTRGLTE
jgi:hypothetical protein